MSGDLPPLTAWDAERSRARVADIELGLTDPVDAWYWRQKAQDRVRALEDDRDAFGLVAHEEAELAALRELLARDATNA